MRDVSCAVRVRLLITVWLSAGLTACISNDDDGSSSQPRSSATSVAASSLSSVTEASSSSPEASSTSSASSLQSSESSVVSSVNSSTSSSSTSSTSSAASSVPETVTISGRVTYDYVPIKNPGGLDYDATEGRPVRWAEVQLLDASDTTVDSTRTDTDGHYTLEAPAATEVRVRVLAQSVATGAQNWNIRVEDNTDGNALYGMVGGLVASGTGDSVRDLHAPSGWGGSSYTDTRVAAPFAILDTAYESLQTLRAVDSTFTLETSYFRWSELNNTASGVLSDGDIGTSFYNTQENALYILGIEDDDTDEYDRHVIAHEWGHYLEDVLVGRMDSIGGPHSSLDKLDMRVAWSEGFANAFSGIALDDPVYLDSFGSQQSQLGGVSISNTSYSNAGWYNEGSIQSMLYNFSAAQGFDKIYNVLTHSSFGDADSMLSVYTFTDRLENLHPGVIGDWQGRLDQQNINSSEQFGAGEVNDGGDSFNLPVYKTLPADGTVENICNTQINGAANKLGVVQFLRAMVPASGSYILSMVKSNDPGRETDPDIYVYYRGALIDSFISEGVDAEEGAIFLESGREYILEAEDWETHSDTGSDGYEPSCFDITLAPAA